MIDRFIEIIMSVINQYYNCYYEEAPSNATFPYLVMPSLTVSPLNSGYLAVFDIEVYNNELSKTSVEAIMDKLRDELDSYSYNNDISFHVSYNSQTIIKSNEQDLIVRRISFDARIFR